VRSVSYLPFSFRWDGSRPDKSGRWDFGLVYNLNLSVPLFDNRKDFQKVTGSDASRGDYSVLNGYLSREQSEGKDWKALARLDWQVANQPLISNEQFGDGGVAGVRGYREGEVFGDTGWRITSEQRTPSVTTYIDGTKPIPVTVRGSVFMDYGTTYLLAPNGNPGSTALWGAGFGFTGTVGTGMDVRMLFAVPLRTTPTTTAGKLLFNVAVSAQF